MSNRATPKDGFDPPSSVGGNVWDAIGHGIKKGVGVKRDKIALHNHTQSEVMIVFSEEDFAISREKKLGANAGMEGMGGNLEWVSKATRSALEPQRRVLQAGAIKDASISLERATYMKVFTRQESAYAWADATLVLHYERVLDEGQKEAHIKVEHLATEIEIVAGKHTRRKQPGGVRVMQQPASGEARGKPAPPTVQRRVKLPSPPAERNLDPDIPIMPPRFTRTRTGSELPIGAESDSSIAHQSLESVVGLKVNEHAMVLRSSGAWTFARFTGWRMADYEYQQQPHMVFLVERDGTEKVIPLTPYATSYVRTVKSVYLVRGQQLEL